MNNKALDLASSRIGEILDNSLGLKAKIINISDKRTTGGNVIFIIQFIKSGYICEHEYKNLKNGSFKDFDSPSVYGVGYTYKGAKSSDNPLYKTWNHMLERCYNPKVSSYHWYGGKGVKVVDEWLYFINFEKDAKTLLNYDKYKIDSSSYSLDKDILGNSMIYSKDTCMFATCKEQVQAQVRVKKIKCIAPNGEVTIFNSKCEACNITGVKNANLYKVLKGERKHSLGYRFEEINEYK